MAYKEWRRELDDRELNCGCSNDYVLVVNGLDWIYVPMSVGEFRKSEVALPGLIRVPGE